MKVGSLVAGLLFCLATGCDGGSEGPSGEAGPGDEGGVGAADDILGQSDWEGPREGMSVELPGGGSEALTGNWAQMLVVGTLTEVPVIGLIETRTTTVMRWQMVEAEGGAVTIEQSACSLVLESGTDLIASVIPDSFVKAILPISRPAEVSRSEVPAAFHVPRAAEVHGVHLENPLDDSMPTSADDERVFDQDRDGHPGMTVFVTGMVDGAIWVVQRNIGQYDGTVTGPGRISGAVVWEQEQVVLGSDNPILADSPPSVVSDPDPAKSYFTAVRIDSSWDCLEILQQGKKLFE